MAMGLCLTCSPRLIGRQVDRERESDRGRQSNHQQHTFNKLLKHSRDIKDNQTRLSWSREKRNTKHVEIEGWNGSEHAYVAELNSSPINDDIFLCLYHLGYLISCQFVSFCLKCTSSESRNTVEEVNRSHFQLSTYDCNIFFLRSSIFFFNQNHIFLKLTRYFFSINLISE